MLETSGHSLDALATILTCSSVASVRGEDDAKPFGPRGWAKVTERLNDRAFGGPGGLIGLSAAEIQTAAGLDEPEAVRLAGRLDRAGQLPFELERLASRGIWALTLADEAYPAVLRDRLGPDAPPVLFGAGERGLLDGGGIAIVGSREADDEAVAFTQALAGAAAAGGTSVVSGGARGIDQAAMRAAFARGGAVVGALPEGVERRIGETETRTALAEGLAVVVSPYHPSAAFSVAAAMGRNKLIYALSDVAVVVSSAADSGGTWAGAVDALKAGWVPVLVRDGPSVPEGNRQLIAKGARPLPGSVELESITSSGLLALAGTQAKVAETPESYEQQPLILAD